MIDQDDEAAGSTHNLGTCCACGGAENVRNIICLNKLAPAPGKGWACVVCGLPPIGALAVLCDRCLESNAEPRWACAGYPGTDGRVPIEELQGKAEHDMSKHPHEPGTCRICGCTDEDCSDCIVRTGEPCTWVEPDLCSACAPERVRIED